MEITYDYYRIFYYVARYKSITGAAEKLGASQPNVTKFISNLESQLGLKLFVRSNRGVKLTKEGEILYQRVSIAFNQIREAEIELANEKNLESGTITVGISEIALHEVLVPVIERFHEKHPNLKLNILNYSTPQALKALKTGVVDFIVVSSPPVTDTTLAETKLKTFNEILIGSNKFANLISQPKSIEEICQYNIIGLAKETSSFAYYNQIFSSCGQVFQPSTEAATADQLLPLIKCGLGLGFVPESFAKADLDSGEVVKIPLKEKLPPRNISLIEDKNSPLTIPANALKQVLIEYTKN